uniref:Cytochrome P450 4C1-like n=1 Tax=Diabrotica virgifera virgifera TaxID=50390 RepID=A0A6P7H6N8_DIAVI
QIFQRDRALSKTYFPIYKKYAFGMAMVNLIDPGDIQLVLSNSKHNQKSVVYRLFEDWLGIGVLTSNGDTWHRRRKLLNSAFQFNMLENFLYIFNKETKQLVQYFRENCDKPYIDVVDAITRFTLFSIGETAFGQDFQGNPKREDYVQAVHDYGEAFVYRIARPWFLIPWLYKLSPSGKRHQNVLKTLHDFSSRVIRERSKSFDSNPNSEMYKSKKMRLIDLLLSAKIKMGVIDDKGIKNEVNTFIFAGHDTTANSICHALLLLANEPLVQVSFSLNLYFLYKMGNQKAKFEK